MKKNGWFLLFSAALLAGCGAEEAKTKTAETEPAEQAAASEPAAGEVDEELTFAYPATLEEAVAAEGKWWEKIEDDELTEEDKTSIVQQIGKIDEADTSEESRQAAVSKLLFDTFHPELPPINEFTPQEKLTLEELDTGSNIKLNGREVKENVNVAIVLDASGSMKAEIDGKSRMEIAKEAINEFAANLPEKTNVSLSVYGHKGTGDDSDKGLSCSAIEEVYPLGTYNQSSFNQAVEPVQASGWTPISAALAQAGEKLTAASAGKEATNVIYVVSDGKETCDGNPAQTAKQLAESDIQAIINVIGFSIEDGDEASLRAVADAAGGEFIEAKNEQELRAEFEKSNDAMVEWINWRNSNTTDAINQKNNDVTDLINLKNKFVNRMIQYKNTSVNALIQANNEFDLDPDVYDGVRDELEDYYETIRDMAEEDYETKRAKVENDYEAVREEIDTEYEANTGE
ncbi:vWA domain-containing protein [Domibacillus indicus]|uniref:vWA domain-containing protein n=1 Tax=Domibacillus indicus TaxID=1437523 RepID=UPI000696C5F3|nr:VWA domain-containing protein [Domibacillus indicus]